MENKAMHKIRDVAAISRRRFVLSLAASFGLGVVADTIGTGFGGGRNDPLAETLRENRPRFTEVWKVVVPPDGYNTSIVFGEAIMRLIAAGAVDPQKFRRLYEARGGLPTWVDRLLTAPSTEPIRLSLETASYLLNLLWPLGLSTKTAFNTKSPINRVSLPSFASTAGWKLGKAANGYVYFNQVETMRLDAEQEEIVLTIARNVFRPCCNNSTFFQDCNHGSALLGFIELAASQGATSEALYRIALAANSYWYPNHYVEIALYLQEIEGRSWTEVPPATILSKRFSSLSGWRRNVHSPLKAANLLPRLGPKGQSGCGV
jgi:hypothetical protein